MLLYGKWTIPKEKKKQLLDLSPFPPPALYLLYVYWPIDDLDKNNGFCSVP